MGVVTLWSFLVIAIVVVGRGGGSCEASTCDGVVKNLTERRGVITSPNFPERFATPIHCRWRIDTTGYDTSVVTVFLTQLFLRTGLKFTGYDSQDEYERKAADSCSTREVTMYDISHSYNYTSSTKYLEIELKLDRLEGNHLRVENALLDVYGFNLTYEVGATPKPTCNVVTCSFLGHCYASRDFQDYQCFCFDEYYGHDCRFGPSCNDTENPCKNGASCRLVGASNIVCDKSTSIETQADDQDFGNAPCSGKCSANQQQMSACEYCESNPNCLMQCNYGHRHSVCDYPSHYILVLTTETGIKYNQFFSESTCLGLLLTERLRDTVLYSLANHNITADFVEVDCSNPVSALVHLMIPKESREEMDNITDTPDALIDAERWLSSSARLVLHEEPLLTLLNISITAGQQIRSLGDDFEITCVAQGSRFLTFSWFKDNIPIKEDSNNRISNQSNLSSAHYASTLFILNTTLETHGLYTCQASDFNFYLQQCKCLEVFVLAEWNGQIEYQKEVVEKHSNLTLSCSSSPSTFYFWKKNNEDFEMSHTEFWEDVFPIGTVLKSFIIQESVNFTCLMAGPTGIHAVEYQVIVDSTRCADENCENVCFRNKILSCGGKGNCALLTDCEEAARINLGCKIDSFDNKARFEAVINMTNLRVVRENKTLLDEFLTSFNMSIYEYFHERNTSITNLETIPRNLTHFKVQFIIKEKDWDFSRLAVTDSVKDFKISKGGARIGFFKMDEVVLKDFRSNRDRVFENDDFQLSCLAHGNGSAVSFEWYKDGVRIDPYYSSSKREMWYHVKNENTWLNSELGVNILDTEHIASLGVHHASKLHQGWYTCRVFDGENQFCKSVKISVVTPPEITVAPLSQTVRKDANVSVRCRHSSPCVDKLSQRYEWMENGISLSVQGSNYSRGYLIRDMIRGGSHLRIFNVQASAEYSCQFICNELRSAPESSYVCVMRNEDPFCHESGWPATGVGCTVRTKCPAGYIGKYVSRRCSETSFEPPDGSQCIRNDFANSNQTLNQLMLGYQNGSVESLLVSFNNFLSKNLTFLPGEKIESLFIFMDDSYKLVTSILSSHSQSLDINLETVTEVSFRIFSQLLGRFNSTDSTQVILSISDMMHPWIFLFTKHLDRKDEHFNISTSNFYAASNSINDFKTCSSGIPMEFSHSDGSYATPLIGVKFQNFPCNESLMDQPSFSVMLFKNSSLYIPSRSFQDSQFFSEGAVALPEVERVIVSVASNGISGSTSNKVNLTMAWKVAPAPGWAINCALIQPDELPLNLSVCDTYHVTGDLYGCSCSKLGSFTLVRTYKPLETSNFIYRAIQYCSVFVSFLAGLRLAVSWWKKHTLLLLLKLTSSLVILWYWLQIFFCSDTSFLRWSCLQILITSLITSQLLVIYFKTCELHVNYKYLMILVASGFPVLIMISVDCALILANSSASSLKIALLWLFLTFNFLLFVLFSCLHHKMKSQYPGKTCLMGQEINSCAALMVLMGAVEFFQTVSSITSISIILDFLCLCCCLSLSLALLIFQFAVAVADKFSHCVELLFSIFGCFCKDKPASTDPRCGKQETNSNAVEEQVPLTDQPLKREIRSGMQITRHKGHPPNRSSGS